MRSSFRSRLGLWRSIGMYYWKPRVRGRLRRFYTGFVQEGMLCFDIGAHLGNRTRAFRDLGASVVAVEPQPLCLRYLHRKFDDDPAVQIVPCAVAATSEPVTLHMSSRYPTITTAAGPDWQSTVRQAVSYPIEWDETIEVCSVTLDQLIAEHGIPGFCKIDVEGLEAEVFRGLTHPLPALSFEFFRETESVTRACVHRLEELGQYRYNWSKGETQRLELDLWLSAPALMRVLGQLPAAHLSGDIYAVLV